MTPDEIRAIRRQLRASQAELARMLDIDTGTVSRWERGIHAPSQRQERQLRDHILTVAELDAENTMLYATADADTQDAMDATRAAERAGLTPLAMFLAGRAVADQREGMSAAEWIMGKQHLDSAKLESVIIELQDAGLWPWN